MRKVTMDCWRTVMFRDQIKSYLFRQGILALLVIGVVSPFACGNGVESLRQVFQHEGPQVLDRLLPGSV